jgi:predicted TIM-barrel fold metal-dependent hydrolase
MSGSTLIAAVSIAYGSIFAADLSFIDAHVHLNDLTVQMSLMNSANIDSAVIFTGGDSNNDDILSAATLHPGRLIPFVSVSPEKTPFAGWWRAGDGDAIIQELDARLASGKYKGVGEMSIVHFPSAGFGETEYSPLDPINLRIMDLLAQKYSAIPIMFHCEITYIKEFSKLLDLYPEVKVIWAHGGYAPAYLTARMLQKHRNLTVELSMRTFERHPRSADYWIMENKDEVWGQWLRLIEQYSGQIIVGTDASNRNADIDQKKADSVRLLLSQLTDITRAKVAKENLSQILGFPLVKKTVSPR